MTDAEYEKLKARRILPVVNRVRKDAADGFVLEDEGKAPADPPPEPGPLREQIVVALKTVHDPEIPLNIYDLGLIYEITLGPDASAHVQMTLTAPGCPVAGSLVQEVHDKLCRVPGVRHAKTELVWEPAWSRERMSEAAQLELGLL